MESLLAAVEERSAVEVRSVSAGIGVVVINDNNICHNCPLLSSFDIVDSASARIDNDATDNDDNDGADASIGGVRADDDNDDASDRCDLPTSIDTSAVNNAGLKPRKMPKRTKKYGRSALRGCDRKQGREGMGLSVNPAAVAVAQATVTRQTDDSHSATINAISKAQLLKSLNISEVSILAKFFFILCYHIFSHLSSSVIEQT